MMCENCWGYIEFPRKKCTHCGHKVKWTKKQITLAILWKIFASVIVPFVSVVLIKTFVN